MKNNYFYFENEDESLNFQFLDSSFNFNPYEQGVDLGSKLNESDSLINSNGIQTKKTNDKTEENQSSEGKKGSDCESQPLSNGFNDQLFSQNLPSIPLFGQPLWEQQIEKNTKKERKNEVLEKESSNKPLPPTQYNYEKIKNEIIPKLNISESLKNKFVYNEAIISLDQNLSDEAYLAKKTRDRNKVKEEKTTKKLGRKTKDDDEKGNHTKFSQDNIVKKIKSNSIGILTTTINEILKAVLGEEKYNDYTKSMRKYSSNKEIGNEPLIKDLNYKLVVDDLKRDKNLEFYDMTLKDFFSNPISTKYSTFEPHANKKIIEELLEKEGDSKIINFIFNLRFGDWFDIFTKKENLEDFENFDEYQSNLLNSKLITVEELFHIIEKNDNEEVFFSVLLTLIYNYKRWFFIKTRRDRKEKTNKNNEIKNSDL